MKTDKELKKWFKTVASKEPDKYYATSVLKREGFMRKECSKCGLWFWTVNKEQDVCGDPACQGGTRVVEENPSKVKLSFIEVWNQFKDMFSKWGYKPVKRYPVASRWNPTTDFTMASIAAFQPYVISGEVEPPAKKLVIPQFCLRFGDVDNVGITGAHMTGFVMIGQHMFVSPDEWDQNEVFEHIFKYITEGVGLPKSELTLHEDAWAGGGNYGPCMEFFSRGVELFNQVYMLYEHTDDGDRELDLKVLDMGLGMERVAWFSQGAANIYEATFPQVLRKLEERTKVRYDAGLFQKFSPYSSLLNIDEVEDINKAWQSVGEKMGMDGQLLKQRILPMTAIYSIAEHSRALLVALNDGSLPSNVGGGYNLRVILRRALAFIDQFGWDVSLKEVAAWHAEELKELFPELHDNISEISKILDVETEKYEATKKKAAQIVSRIVHKEITQEVLLELYDSHGVSPDTVKAAAADLGKTIVVPDNFYTLVAEMHEQKEKKLATHKEKQLDLSGIDDTEILYWGTHKLLDFKAKVLKVIGDDVVLDKTAFYPTSGGQLHDVGTLGGASVLDVFKQGAHVVHKLEDHDLQEGDEVDGHVDGDRRLQLAVHHTATHILNGAAKKVLGRHIWQAGAAKTLEKARLDITHYDSLSPKETDEIEKSANDMIKQDLPVNKMVLPRQKAEAKYGFVLYQGGAVPGKNIRVVEIPGFDVEACGGTHLDRTGEVGEIKILKSSKLQDGIVRLEYVAGGAVGKVEKVEGEALGKVAELLGVSPNQVPARAEEVFQKWKKARKAVKKKQPLDAKELDLVRLQEMSGSDDEILEKTAAVLSTQPQHVENTLRRFISELEEMKGKLSE
ncbi:alanine--tRNA ligase [Candidatus Woesearchaeota archaeon]|nr:alanine--tRNA ligase [Candidatus Woesearchaeota archaeon]